jgi:hypothetical protein
MYEQPQANSVEEYLAPLKEMFAKYVPADEVACIVIETTIYLFAQNLVEYHRQRLKYHVHDKSFLTLQNTLELNKVLGEQVNGVQSRILILRLI